MLNRASGFRLAPSATSGYLIVALLLAGAWWLAQGEKFVPQQTSGIAATAISQYRHDLATVHRSAARRLRSGEIASEADLHAFIKFAEHKARQRAYAPLDEAQAHLSGNRWSSAAAAQLCDNIGTELEN